MEYVKRTAPFIRKNVSVERMMRDVLIALTPVTLFAMVSFGPDAIIRIFLSVFICIASEVIVFGLTHKPEVSLDTKGNLKKRYKTFNINNLITPAITGLIYSLLLPSTLNLYVVCVGALGAILLGKLVFGGLGNNIFNPAAIGRVIILICFASFFTYSANADLITSATPLGALNNLGLTSAITRFTLTDLLFGNIPGAMGEINALAILVGAAYLLIRRAADYKIVVSVLGTSIILFCFAGLGLAINNVIAYDQILIYVLYQVLSGGLLFGAVFMATDPVTSPINKYGRYIYGVLISILVVAIRLFGGFPEGVALAIIFANIFVPLIDYFKITYKNHPKTTYYILGSLILVFGGVILLYIGR
ncbi:MAG: RnfABCDGE type electron transport complex subunit D [Acholeplasmatales bacterium]|jgi:electron transport complex protein RnfD|nr:RnfABCDGE type electron transport complex subunit D [Acholeplasmatales bacterium]